MKTLDEVIKVFEQRCCQGCDKCPYYPDDCLSYLDEPLKDALHYLKEYRDTDEYYKKAIAHVTEVIDHYEKMVADYLAVNNPPLTWDELRTMEGKPVWVEESAESGLWWTYWVIWEGDNAVLPKKDYSTKWQAYRKERE